MCVPHIFPQDLTYISSGPDLFFVQTKPIFRPDHTYFSSGPHLYFVRKWCFSKNALRLLRSTTKNLQLFCREHNNWFLIFLSVCETKIRMNCFIIINIINNMTWLFKKDCKQCRTKKVWWEEIMGSCDVICGRTNFFQEKIIPNNFSIKGWGPGGPSLKF